MPMYITAAPGTDLTNMQNGNLNILLQRLTRGWNLARLLRVFVGAAILVSATHNGEWFFAAIAAFLLLSGLFNIGCSTACYTGYHANAAEPETKDIDFEEIKNNT